MNHSRTHSKGGNAQFWVSSETSKFWVISVILAWTISASVKALWEGDQLCNECDACRWGKERLPVKIGIQERLLASLYLTLWLICAIYIPDISKAWNCLNMKINPHFCWTTFELKKQKCFLVMPPFVDDTSFFFLIETWFVLSAT